MSDQYDRYRELAGWDPYVEKLRGKLEGQSWERLIQQVADRAGQSFRPRGPGISVLDRPNRLIVRRETPAEHSLRQVAWWRGLVYHWYAKQDAQDEPKAINLREYEAQRLNRISRMLGTCEHIGSPINGKTKWVSGRDLGAVLNGGDRTPATVGKVLGMLDWFQHCLAAHEREKPTEEQEKVKVEDAALFPSQGEQSTKVKFRNRFTADDADKIAWEVKLTDIEGNYTGLPGKSAGRLCGFYWRLKQAGKVEGSLEALRDFFAERYLKRPITTTPNMNSNVARDMADDVENALKQLFSTDDRG